MSEADAEGLPDELAAAGRASFQRLLESFSDGQRAELLEQVEESVLAAELHAVLACSDYVARVARSQPEWLLEFLSDRRFNEPFSTAMLDSLIDRHLETASDMDALMRGLRLVRGAAAWIHEQPRPIGRARFDVIVCECSRDERDWRLRHLEAAFDANA